MRSDVIGRYFLSVDIIDVNGDASIGPLLIVDASTRKRGVSGPLIRRCVTGSREARNQQTQSHRCEACGQITQEWGCVCQWCYGRGVHPDPEFAKAPCPDCNGTGVVTA